MGGEDGGRSKGGPRLTWGSWDRWFWDPRHCMEDSRYVGVAGSEVGGLGREWLGLQRWGRLWSAPPVEGNDSREVMPTCIGS